MSTANHLTPENLPNDPTKDWEYAEVESAQLIREEEIPLSIEAVTLAERMGRIQAKLSAEMQRMEEAGRAIAQVVNSIKPTDQHSYTELCERLNDNKTFLDGVGEFIEPWKKLFYRPYTAILERAKEIVHAPEMSQANGKARRLQFEREVKAAADRETARLAKEQRDREEEQRLAAAVKAEEMGLSENAVETILTQPSIAPTPVAVPMISRPSGVRKIAANWQAELEDRAAFWRWAKQQKDMPPMLLIDFPTMNREAKTHKATLGQRFPGWRGVNRGGE